MTRGKMTRGWGLRATHRRRYFLIAFKRGAKKQPKQTGFLSIGYEGGALATLVIPGQAAPNLATGEDGLRALAVALAAYRSAASAEPVSVDIN